ncbi:MAG: ATP12 family protein [Sphingobium sp.]
MKRFYKDAAIVAEGDGWSVTLDGRPMRTPARAALLLPTEGLAHAVAEEWRAQGEEIDPRTMVKTGLANAAIDQVAPGRAAFAEGVALYATSDLLCYRAEGPQELVIRHAAAWNPLLDWARTRYDVAFTVTSGIIPVAQPPETLERMHQTVETHPDFILTALSTLVTLSGSLVCGLAVVERAFDAETVWDAAEIDERWQAEQWGEDAEAAQRAAGRRRDFLAARDFCALAAD